MSTPTITVTDVYSELNAYWEHNRSQIRELVDASITSELDDYATPITKIKGKYPSFHSVMGHLVQGFTSEWSAMGQAQFKHKLMQNYHQKVNAPIKPAEILGTFFAKMRQEGIKPEDQDIAKYIIENLIIPKVKRDVKHLALKGEYDATKLEQYGFSMNGLNKTIELGLADTVNPYYKIPVDTPTTLNAVDRIEQFEDGIPDLLDDRIDKIFVSKRFKKQYKKRYNIQYQDNDEANDSGRSYLGDREIVGISFLDDDIIFACPDGIFGKLLDFIENPGDITDIQKQDYIVKVFMEFTLGYDFFVNQMVCMANHTDATLGLGDAAMNTLYYPEEETVVVP